ncbi:MocR-like pyridoxine biosynthesis transcription factor PdxR [Undibacterium flavidum]|uniref:PLP-dependent aminotransferase family protein n=1 Tax=Undibacterium flavidum TaxID=2762297 RepID=A0ABR6Y7W6_9BURK|nr:PLP-dependent aminotransferase family protein [Undibacterium flavidum]MBC3872701.1 PLP-dependent aminotransferase family protein [Undibacterium flavidum]
MDYALLIKQFSPDNHGKLSAQRKLHAALRNAIQEGALAPGSRLLASRVLAQELGIARNTVVYAYEQLLSEGFVSSDRRGSIVNSIAQVAQQLQTASVTDRADLGLSRRAGRVMPLPVAADLTTGFAPGVPSLADFPKNLWRKSLDASWRRLNVAQLGYADAAGEPDLRAAIAEYLRASRGVTCDAEQVIVTDGTQSSLDLCAHALADAGDKVWMENPGYVGAQIAFQSAQLKLIGIAVDGDGIAPTMQDWHAYRPKFVYVTPSHQYPTGQVLSLNRRLELIQQARLHGALIIEDDYDSEFRHDGPPLIAMQGLVPDAPVIYLGTFSKTMFPALRIAYLVVPKNLVQTMRGLVEKTSLRGRSADQICLAKFIRDGHFLTHLRRMRRLYRQRRDVLVSLLQAQLSDVATVQGDSAGMHLSLCFHDTSWDDVAISQHALTLGVVAPALSKHSVGRRRHAWCGLMLGYAQVPAELMPALVEQLQISIRLHAKSV